MAMEPGHARDEGITGSTDQAPQSAVASSAASASPAGTGDYVVKQGDCISSIAKELGRFWETIWNDSANAQLRELRQDPNVLLPGDRVHMPPKKTKRESGQTEMTHRFRRKGEPTMLRMKLLDDGAPRANVRYVLEIDGQERAGITDGEGKLDEPIPGNARRGKLVLAATENQDSEEILLNFGHLDPITAISGVQGRLAHLGFDPGPVDNILGPSTRAALRRFQRDQGLTVTGEPDSTTRAQLVSAHGR